MAQESRGDCQNHADQAGEELQTEEVDDGRECQRDAEECEDDCEDEPESSVRFHDLPICL